MSGLCPRSSGGRAEAACDCRGGTLGWSASPFGNVDSYPQTLRQFVELKSFKDPDSGDTVAQPETAAAAVAPAAPQLEAGDR